MFEEDVRMPEGSEPTPLATDVDLYARLSRRMVVRTVVLSLVLAACAVLAAVCAASTGERWGDALEDAAQQAFDGARRSGVALVGGDERRRLVGTGCRTVDASDPCYEHVVWAMQQGIREHPEWYPGLAVDSPFDDFQAAVHVDALSGCPLPCVGLGVQGADDPENATENATTANGTASGGTDDDASAFRWETSGRLVAQGQWCNVEEPVLGWKIRGCGEGGGITFKVLTYNLFWWNLFGRRQGDGGSAGKLIAMGGMSEAYDVMGFQECESIGWVLGDAGLATEFAGLPGPHAMCIAYRATAWELLAQGIMDIGEDREDQWYGTRSAMWVRLRHRTTRQTVLFVNHHGPLPVDTGGRCGGEATAFNLLKLISAEARQRDIVILVGDFNAGPVSVTVQTLRARLLPVFTGKSFGGVDNIFSSCAAVARTRNLGSGGSDHDALEAVFTL